MGAHKNLRLKEVTKAGNFYTFRQGNNKYAKTQGFELKHSELGSNKFCLYRLLSPKFSVSGGEVTFYPPGTGRVFYTWEIYFLHSVGQKRVRVSFLHWLFLK